MEGPFSYSQEPPVPESREAHETVVVAFLAPIIIFAEKVFIRDILLIGSSD